MRSRGWAVPTIADESGGERRRTSRALRRGDEAAPSTRYERRRMQAKQQLRQPELMAAAISPSGSSAPSSKYVACASKKTATASVASASMAEPHEVEA
eukprot:scaffold95215_cov26-Tisochrysis_lutea.AAC.5